MQMTNADEWNFDGKKEGDSNDGDESIISDVSDGSQVTANIISVATARVHTAAQESPLASPLASTSANTAELLETSPDIRNVQRKPPEDCHVLIFLVRIRKTSSKEHGLYAMWFYYFPIRS
jgi:hypothetical protein